eukprot:3329791-Amphidinium_carterae.1
MVVVVRDGSCSCTQPLIGILLVMTCVTTIHKIGKTIGHGKFYNRPLPGSEGISWSFNAAMNSANFEVGMQRTF